MRLNYQLILANLLQESITSNLHMKNRTLTFLGAGLTFALVISSSAQAAVLWTEGHGDIGVGYEGGELHPHWHVEGGTVDGTPRPDEEFNPADLNLVVPNIPNAKTTRNASPSWAPIGVGAGETYWRLSTNPLPGVPYMGWATEELLNLDWTGPITFALTGLVAPGNISVYYFPDGDLTFLWASSNGISGADSFDLETGVHQHFNIAFSAPGLYEVEVTISGTHAMDGLKTATQTFGFSVVPEPSSALLFVAGLGFLAARRVRRS